MSGTQQWPPATPPPVVFVPPEPEREPAVKAVPVRAPKAEREPEASGRALSELTDDEVAAELAGMPEHWAALLTEVRSRKARRGAEARRQAGLPLGRAGKPDRQPRKPYRDRAALIAAAKGLLASEERLTVSGLMKSLRVGHTVAKEVIAALEAKGVIERDESGWFEK